MPPPPGAEARRPPAGGGGLPPAGGGGLPPAGGGGFLPPAGGGGGEADVSDQRALVGGGEGGVGGEGAGGGAMVRVERLDVRPRRGPVDHRARPWPRVGVAGAQRGDEAHPLARAKLRRSPTSQ